MKKIYKFIKYTILFFVAFIIMILVGARVTSLQPEKISEEEVTCPGDAPVLESGKEYKVLNWNIQYLAGKNYVFFYNNGPDERPTGEDIEKTANEIAKIIIDEKPDIILFQEVDDGAKRTDYEDQLNKILGLLPGDYKCHASAFYWKNSFNPHPSIFGSTGMKVSTISKYKISKAKRLQLPIYPDNFFVKNFNLKRAILDTRLPLQNGKELVVMNTHLDAFAQGSDTMWQQVVFIKDYLNGLKNENKLWFIGGDFNLLPPGFPRDNLMPESIPYYNPKSEIGILFDNFSSVVPREEMTGDKKEDFFTHYPNTKKAKGPDRTIDYIFYGNIEKGKYFVRKKDTLKISDHLPLITYFKF